MALVVRRSYHFGLRGRLRWDELGRDRALGEVVIPVEFALAYRGAGGVGLL